MTTLSDPAPADRDAEHPDAVAATGDALRTALRGMASPVVVVTVAYGTEARGTEARGTEARGTEARGATIGSFASVSLDPPLVSFNVTHGSQLHAALGASERFTVHLLAADQAAVASHFARPDLSAAAQAAGADGAIADGLYRLDGTLGTLACTIRTRVIAGDHTVVIGEVTDLAPGRDAPPLLYYRQSYRGVGREV